MRSKTKLTKGRFGKKVLFKKCLYFLLEPNNVRICYVYETHEVEFIILRSLFTGLHGWNIAQRYVEHSESSTFWRNLLLNNTFWTSHYSNIICTRPGNLNYVARPRLKSDSSVFTLRPQFASLYRIVVLSTRRLILSLLRPWYPLFSKQIIL